MADSLELILRVCPVPEDDARELAMLAGWLRSELLDLHVRSVNRLPAAAARGSAKGSADIGDLLSVQLDPKAFQVVMARVNAWAAESDRMVEISSRGHTVILGSPSRHGQAEDVDGSLEPGAEASLAGPEDETEALVHVSSSVVPTSDTHASEPGQALLPVPYERLLPIGPPPRGGGELARRNRLAEACILMTRRIDVPALPREESRSTGTFALISAVLSASFAALLSVGILAIARHLHRLGIAANYPIHRVYHEVVRYFVRVTPAPGNAHILLVYTVYLAVVPVLFAVVFMYLKPGGIQLIVAVLACVIFIAAPFMIVITSIRSGSANCGSWNYPEPDLGSGCFNTLEIAFRIAFAVGIAGLAAPVVFLIRGRRHGRSNGLLLGSLTLLASGLIGAFSSVGNVARRPARSGSHVGRDRNALGTINQYLLPNEQQIIAIRQHPIVLLGSSMLALAGAVLAVVLSATAFRGNETFIVVVWIAWLMLLIRMIWKAIDWRVSFFVVTSHRLVLVFGALTRKVSMLPLTKVTDMSLQRSYAGRMLGFGEFIIESAGVDQALRSIEHIPYPEQIYLEICGLLFLDSSYQEGADEPDSIEE